MRLNKLLAVSLLSYLILMATSSIYAGDITSFDSSWLFCQDDELTGAEVVGFDDSGWREVDLPHDWSIEGPIDRDSPTGRGGGFMPCGIAWYRKSFAVPASDKGKRIFIDFDGIMSNSEVWVNGRPLGTRPFGYVSMRYELTDKLNYGGANIIAVKTDTYDQPASRWYTGAGIYRHTYLVKTAPVHFEHWGVFIMTPKVTEAKAEIKIDNKIVNQGDTDQDFQVVTNIYKKDDMTKPVFALSSSAKAAAGKTVDITQGCQLLGPALWSVKNPNLYIAESTIVKEGKVIDVVKNIFGIRSFEFKAETGFWLNGENIKIKGVCLHHDGGAVGAAVPKEYLRYRFEKLKEIGCNAIRTAHNPMSTEFLDLCDEMGFVVMDEVFDTWRARKNHADYGYQHYFDKWWYADNRDTVMRDRNHPSIILYSAGNEIRDNLDSKKGFDTFKSIYNNFKEYDPTRPVTQGVFRPNHSNLYDNGYVEMMDVVGQNYRENELVAAHLSRPSRKVIGTENGHSREAWLVLRDNPYMAGQFLWTGIDYLGEADWPNVGWSNACVNRIGTIRPLGYQRQSWWSDEPVVHIARREAASGGASGNIGGGEIVSHWTPRDYDTYDQATVEIYSNCELVELFLNDKSLGEKVVPADASPIKWELGFKPGTLKAVGKINGREAAVYETTSSAYPVAIKIEPNKTVIANEFDDAAVVLVSFVDEKGIKCPWAEKLIKFEISGPGKIIAVDNGDPQFHDSYQASKCRTFHGECMVVVAATADSGDIMLKATCRGIESSSVTLQSEPAALR